MPGRRRHPAASHPAASQLRSRIAMSSSAWQSSRYTSCCQNARVCGFLLHVAGASSPRGPDCICLPEKQLSQVALYMTTSSLCEVQAVQIRTSLTSRRGAESRCGSRSSRLQLDGRSRRTCMARPSRRARRSGGRRCRTSTRRRAAWSSPTLTSVRLCSGSGRSGLLCSRVSCTSAVRWYAMLRTLLHRWTSVGAWS
jgi:hypothetical protein